MTGTYETEKLWHPLLLQILPDGSYLHSSDADISRGREEECRDRLAGRAMEKNSLFVRCLRPYHASTLPPIEKPFITGIRSEAHVGFSGNISPVLLSVQLLQ